mmetsp:Transcript_122006/g.390090  ORF Transcript_122006/g.390090 Transcript_122006/m.390090 type:complete len:265 (+) Transcript_122006:3455-4249(+)
MASLLALKASATAEASRPCNSSDALPKSFEEKSTCKGCVKPTFRQRPEINLVINSSTRLTCSMPTPVLDSMLPRDFFIFSTPTLMSSFTRPVPLKRRSSVQMTSSKRAGVPKRPASSIISGPLGLRASGTCPGRSSSISSFWPLASTAKSISLQAWNRSSSMAESTSPTARGFPPTPSLSSPKEASACRAASDVALQTETWYPRHNLVRNSPSNQTNHAAPSEVMILCTAWRAERRCSASRSWRPLTAIMNTRISSVAKSSGGR